jgi:hypothetical protein
MDFTSTYNDIYSRIDVHELQKYMNDNNWDLDDAFNAGEYFLRDEFSISIDSDGIIEFDKLTPEIEELIGDNAVKLYHFTSDKFKKSILKIGLVQGIKKTNPYNNSYSGIYLTTRTSGNEINGYKYHIRNKHKAGIIRVDVKMYLDEIQNDVDDMGLASGETQFISDDIPVNRIIDISNVF